MISLFSQFPANRRLYSILSPAVGTWVAFIPLELQGPERPSPPGRRGIMATVGLQSLLFSGFFPVEGSKSDPRTAQGSGLLGGEQLLPPAADFASLIRSAILNREAAPPFIAVEGLGETETEWGDLADWVSKFLGQPVRLEAMGATETFQIHQIVPETESTIGAPQSGMDGTINSDQSNGGWIGVLLVGEASPFEVVTPGVKADRDDSPRPTLVLAAPPVVGMEKPTPQSAGPAPIVGESIPIPIPEGDGAWKDTFATSFEILLITTAAATPAAFPVASEKAPRQGEVAPAVDKPIAFETHEPNQLLGTFPTVPAEKLNLHPRFVGAVREAIAQWTTGLEPPKSSQAEGESLPPRGILTEEVPKAVEREMLSIPVETQKSEGMTAFDLSEPEASEFPIKPQMEGMRPKTKIQTSVGAEAFVAPPSISAEIAASPEPTAPALADAPSPAPSPDPIKIPLKTPPASATAIEKPNGLPLKSPEPSKPSTKPDSPLKAPEVRMIPVRVQVVMGEIAQRLESLAGRILETRSDRSGGALPPVAGPIVLGSEWNRPLTQRPVIHTLPPPSTAPVATSGDVSVEPQSVKTSTDGATVASAAAITRQTRSAVQVPAETAKGFPLPKPEGAVREAAPHGAVEEPEAPARSSTYKELVSDSKLPRRIEPTPTGNPIVPKAAERATPAPLESSAGVSIDRSPLNVSSTLSPLTVSRSEVLTNGAAPSLPTETENAAVEQIARTLRGRTLAQGGEIKIRLVPESLGEIHLRITIRAGQLIAEIRANSEGTREILTRNTTQLQGLLAEAGSGVEKVVIRTGGFGGDLINASTAPRDPGAGGDSAEDRERTPKDRQENQSHQREQSKGNKRRFLWERFV